MLGQTYPSIEQMPLPPPVPQDFLPPGNEYSAPNDHSPPQIQIPDQELHAGRNVYVFILKDESTIHRVTLNFTQSKGISHPAAIAQNPGGTFRSLLNLAPGNASIYISAVDAAGNEAVVHKEYWVSVQLPWWDQLVEGVGLITHFLRSVLGV